MLMPKRCWLTGRSRNLPLPCPCVATAWARWKGYGAPQEKLDPRGGQKRQWPTIHRWVYPAFTVYFEKSKVIDVVANQADADEIGPKPPIR